MATGHAREQAMIGVTVTQQQFIADLTRDLADDPHVLAAWLAGSFGRGDADRFSDVDVHVLLEPIHASSWRAQMERRLRALRPLVLYRLMFDGAMGNALSVVGLRIDVWTHVGLTLAVDRQRIRVLHAVSGALIFNEEPDPPPDAAALAAHLSERIGEFWRCIAMLPVVIGRRELIVAQAGLTVEQGIMVDVLLDGYGVARDAGVKKLNPFLPEHLRQAVEDALDMPGLTLRALMDAHLALAAIMQEHGPIIAARYGFTYPVELERAALGYVQRELAAIP